jgi:hypothetical protein
VIPDEIGVDAWGAAVRDEVLFLAARQLSDECSTEGCRPQVVNVAVSFQVALSDDGDGITVSFGQLSGNPVATKLTRPF